MKTLSIQSLRLCLIFGLTSLAAQSASAQERVGDFALLDEQGYFHHMSWYDDHQAIVFLVQANSDAAVQAALPGFADLAEQFSDAGLQFFGLNAMGKHNRDAVHAEMQRAGVAIPVLMDDAQLVAETLGIQRTAEVLVYDPESFTVTYRGSVGPQLSDALQAVADGAPILAEGVDSAGTPIDYAAKLAHQQSVPSYAEDIAPIIAENCASCHREGGVAPFAMDSHTMIRGWSPMIREVLMTKRMPPGQIDPHVGEFSNDMVLDDADAQALVHWIDAGAPHDGNNDPLAALTWPQSEWAFGEPDLVIDVPPQEVPATGVLDYYNVVVDVDLDEDRWVRASQYIPGDRSVLHHTLHSIIPPGQTRGGSLLGGDPDRPGIAPYIPGQAPREELPNTGGLLKAGSRIAMQMHYTTNGRESVDESRIGVWFYPRGFVPEERMSGECACHFTPTWQNIPPHDPDYEMSQTITIEDDAYIYSFTPHMHFRGKRMRFTATFPDGSTEEMLNIANYNYNWQLAYTLKEPRFVPAGTKITAAGAFDNSEQNPMNPDPARSVPWGLQSWDEMFFGAVDWKYTDQSRFQD
jgi:mono/diheme cytochrome c family protein